MAQSIQRDQGQGSDQFNQGTGQQSFGQQGGGQQGPQQIPISIVVDADELEVLLKSLTDADRQLSSSDDTPEWMRRKYAPCLQSVRQAIVQNVNAQLRPGMQNNPAAQQIARALENA